MECGNGVMQRRVPDYANKRRIRRLCRRPDRGPSRLEDDPKISKIRPVITEI
jgi:hypothetical protein